MTTFVLCYDISHPKRLARVYRCLKQYAVPLQYSVFLFTGDHRQLEHLLQQLAAHINPQADDLRAYPLPRRGLKARLGLPALPTGIQLGSLPLSW